MMFLTTLATGIMSSASITYAQSKEASWLATLPASVTGYAVVWLVTELHRLYPGKTIIEYSRDILGSFAGSVVSILLLFELLLLNGNQFRQFGEFLTLGFFQRTPMLFIMGTLACIVLYTSRLGIEVVGRLSILITVAVVTIVIGLMLPIVGEMKLERLLPLLEEGPVPLLKGMAALQIWFPLYMLMAYLLPNVHDVKQARKWGYYSVTWTLASMFGSIVLVQSVLGSAVGSYYYPFMTLSRYVSVFEFFEHLESFVMILWVLDLFVRSVLTCYAFSLGYAQLMRTSDYRTYLLPSLAMMLAISIWIAPNSTEYISNALKSAVFYYFSAHFLIPAGLWLASLFRRRAGKATAKEEGAAQEG